MQFHANYLRKCSSFCYEANFPKQSTYSSMCRQMSFLSRAVFQQQAVPGPLEHQKAKQGGGGGGMGPVACQNCGKPCKGEALRVQNKHFHIKCFACKGKKLSDLTLTLHHHPTNTQ